MTASKPTLICETCGKPFKIKPARVKLGAAFCSKPCYNLSGRANGKIVQSIEDRFWAKVTKTNHCWVWTAGTDANGYGRISTSRNHSPMLAHRLSYKIHHGTLPDDLGVLHKCDNPPCVNPDHLFLGSQKANMSDCSGKKRNAFGEKATNSRLTASDIPIIRQRYATESISYARLGEDYNVAATTIASVISRRNWSHIH